MLVFLLHKVLQKNICILFDINTVVNAVFILYVVAVFILYVVAVQKNVVLQVSIIKGTFDFLKLTVGSKVSKYIEHRKS